MKKALIIIGTLLVFFGSVHATTTCLPSSISITFSVNDQPQNMTITCINDDPNSTISLMKIGEHFSFTPNTIGPSETKIITLEFDSSAPIGRYYGWISFNDSSNPIPVTITVEPKQETECTIDVFPTVLTNIKVPQGEKKSRQILITVPECFPDKVNFRAVALESNIPPIELGELALGQLSPGTSVQIPLIFDATNCQTGTYYETLSFNIANASGIRIPVPSVSISVTVTSGIMPITNETFSTLPSCSIPSNLILNQTYQVLCSDVDPNLQVHIGYNEYLKGLKVSTPSNQFIWDFKPIKEGDTTLKIWFTFKGAPIGSAIEQEMRISSVGSPSPIGGNITLKIFPSPEKINKPMNISILCMNDLGDIIPCTLYVNGAEINGNVIGVEPGKTYEIHATSTGYHTAHENITISLPKIQLLILNKEGDVTTSFDVGDQVEVVCRDPNTAEPINCHVLLDGSSSASTFTANKEGNHTIEVEAEGYESASKTVVFKPPVKVLYAPEKLELNKEAVIMFNKETEYMVTFREDGKSAVETITSGTGKNITFIPEKRGTYYVFAKDLRVKSYEIKKAKLFPEISLPGREGLAPVLFAIVAIIAYLAYKKFFKKKKLKPLWRAPTKKTFPVEEEL